MGLFISGLDFGPYPRPTYLRLTCDRCPATWGPCWDGYVRAHRKAIAEGWSETSLRILCPSCAGRRPMQGKLDV